LQNSESGQKGLAEVDTVLDLLDPESGTTVLFDVTLARGLNYYTGMIFEVRPAGPAAGVTGSLLGGGRYDDLTGIFGLPGVSGVGISFGVDRIYDVLDGLGRFKEAVPGPASTQVLLVNFGEAEARHAIGVARALRAGGVATEVYPEAAKVKKQMAYADANQIPYVALLGSEEIKTGKLTVKDMATGEQHELDPDGLIEKIGAHG
jgi:histidyl-tRNA synthetase